MIHRTGCCGHAVVLLGQWIGHLKRALINILRSPLQFRLVGLALQVPMTQSLVQVIRCDNEGNILGTAGSCVILFVSHLDIGPSSVRVHAGAGAHTHACVPLPPQPTKF